MHSRSVATIARSLAAVRTHGVAAPEERASASGVTCNRSSRRRAAFAAARAGRIVRLRRGRRAGHDASAQAAPVSADAQAAVRRCRACERFVLNHQRSAAPSQPACPRGQKAKGGFRLGDRGCAIEARPGQASAAAAMRSTDALCACDSLAALFGLARRTQLSLSAQRTAMVHWCTARQATLRPCCML